ncbi:hypothetical protein MKEN_01050900 [Mycena kentingensis (nom. inval.)]|nr:hypothetical protein MKEN_01050900 [Mycena kentingensis (nom. inval.)]
MRPHVRLPTAARLYRVPAARRSPRGHSFASDSEGARSESLVELMRGHTRWLMAQHDLRVKELESKVADERAAKYACMLEAAKQKLNDMSEKDRLTFCVASARDDLHIRRTIENIARIVRGSNLHISCAADVQSVIDAIVAGSFDDPILKIRFADQLSELLAVTGLQITQAHFDQRARSLYQTLSRSHPVAGESRTLVLKEADEEVEDASGLLLGDQIVVMCIVLFYHALLPGAFADIRFRQSSPWI